MSDVMQRAEQTEANLSNPWFAFSKMGKTALELLGNLNRSLRQAQ